MARPTKLTPELTERFVAELKRTLYLQTAATIVGVTPKTVQNWMNRGEAGDNGYGAFFRAVKAALAEVEATRVEAVTSGCKNWQAHAWILERRWPGRWAANRGELAKALKQLHALGVIAVGQPVPQADPGGGAPDATAGGQ